MLICRCPHCMGDLSGYEQEVPPICGYGMDESGVEYKHGLCPLCGFDIEGTEQPAEALPRNTILHGKYLIGNVLGQGGFGITYIGFDLSLEIKVAIKEYYPAGSVIRHEGKNSVIWNDTQNSRGYQKSAYEDFLKEARKMAKMDQILSIVRVRETFLENETAYIVMDYVEGETLKARLKRDGVMKFSDCIALLRPMMEDLEKVHAQGLIHRDISPDNIMIQPDGKVKLLDLGAAKDLTLQKEGVSQLVTKKGFSPFEQYMDSGKIGPWTDVYALCATIYYACFGKLIPSALERMDRDTLSFNLPSKEPLSKSAINALKNGLELRVKDRTPSVGQLLEEIQKSPKEEVLKPDSGVDTPIISVVQAPVKTKAESKPETKIAAESTVSLENKEDHFKADHLTADVTLSETDQPASKTKRQQARSRKYPRWMIPVGAVAVLFLFLVCPYIIPSKVTEMEIVTDDEIIGVYTGWTIAGEPFGEGTMYYKNGDYYEGGWFAGKRSGQGSISYAEGNVNGWFEYVGEWSNDLRDGQGRLTRYDGAVYEGEWANGKKNGQGTMTYAEGNLHGWLQYTGDWVEDHREGQGIMTYANGDVYEGEWKYDLCEGQGTYSYNSGAIYEGEWADGKKNGQGTMTYVGGVMQYVGEWVDDVREGQGRNTYVDGTVYEGEWVNDQREGQGTTTYAENDKSGRVSYTGSWLQDKRSGTGTMTWQNGDIYEGEWKNNTRFGWGTMYYSDGTQKSGFWSGSVVVE